MDLYVRPCVSSTCLIYAVSYAVRYSNTVRYTVRFKRVPNGQEGSISSECPQNSKRFRRAPEGFKKFGIYWILILAG